MARSGVYRTDVKKARDALLAQGKTPSLDAVRIALGNTGSKTTIHKHLKELQEEEGGLPGHRASISEAIQDLVERLARQLQEEATVRIDAMKEESAAKERQHAATAAALREELERVRERFTETQGALELEREGHQSTRRGLQDERIERTRVDQQVADLKERLAENESHRKSLEDKHTHAREALEHYRESVKDQRDQDQRRHEQEIQGLRADLRQAQQSVIVKQNEITKLNQEGARLVAELKQTRSSLYDEQASVRRLEQSLEASRETANRRNVLEAQLVERTAQIERLTTDLVTTRERRDCLAEQVLCLDRKLAQAQAKQIGQQEIVAELRTLLQTRSNGTD